MSIDAALSLLAREDGGRVLAILARRFGDVDLADESVQDAFVEAVETWPRLGVPDQPAAWLMTVAGRKGIDRLRRSASARRRTMASAPELTATDDMSAERVVDGVEVGDEHLRLMLLCCHPALHQDAQVALTLRLAGGLTATEIAAGLLVPESTVAQRLVRAKRKIRDAGMPLSMPDALDERVDALLDVLYLIFNEGYLSRAVDEVVVRIDLADEAIRLTRQVYALLPRNAEIGGLLALLLFHRARFATRADSYGDLILLEHQDRSRWDAAMITEANGVLVDAFRSMVPGRFQLQGVIAALHANAPTSADTDWSGIADAYGHLLGLTASPVVAVNRAVAVSMVEGPLAGLALLDRVSELPRYHLLHAARGELLGRSGDPSGAVVELERARELADNPAEQRHLDRRILWWRR